MKEIWKDIDNKYQVSSNGSVRNKRNKMKAWPNMVGYVDILLYGRKHYLVHRLVAKAFIPNTENKPCVNHKNGIKTDNRVENLEWVTYSENMQHCFKTGLQKIGSGKDNPLSKAVRQLTIEGLFVRQFGSLNGNIGQACKTGKVSYGYKWEYI